MGWGARLAAFIFIASAVPAAAAGVRVRWLPSPDPRVVGYNVYLRHAGTVYGAPTNAGKPAVGADGTIAYTLPVVLGSGTYYVALTSYAADKTESTLSQELPLGPVDPCTIDSCQSPKQCIIGERLPDGTPCDDHEFCAACHAGICSPGATEVGQVDRIGLAAHPGISKLALRSRFTVPPTFDPQSTEMTLTVGEPSQGVVLYRADVPGSLLQQTPRGRIFHYRTTNVRGVGRMTARLVLVDGNASLKVRATTSDLSAYLPINGLGVAVRFGANDCWERTDLACSSSLSTVICPQ